MANIRDIVAASSYEGSANLGGFVPDAIDIDTKPLQTLALFTVEYNKAEYRQRQLDAEEQAKELASLAAWFAEPIFINPCIFWSNNADKSLGFPPNKELAPTDDEKLLSVWSVR